MPNKIKNPIKISDIRIDYNGMISHIAKAHSSLSYYNGILAHLVNPHILLAPLTVKESTVSSIIEGTQTTFSEVLQHDAGEIFDLQKSEEIQEVLNYRSALDHAVLLLNDRPFITLNMVKSVHAILLAGVRGENKSRGEFRNIQNWIGAKNSTIESASFIPPPPNKIFEYLDEWEKFINSDFDDLLVQTAIMHAQFEIIHPFLDGNGRLGRLLIPIFLYSKGYLSQPVFYLSEFFESHRNEYYSHLHAITSDDKWIDWIKFFLDAIHFQADENSKKINQILELYEEMKVSIMHTTNSKYSANIVDAIFSKPIFTSTSFANSANLPNRKTVNGILTKLVDSGILHLIKEARGRKSGMYCFWKLMDILDN